MAEYASDVVLRSDEKVSDHTVTYTLFIGSEAHFTEAQRITLRAAAVTSLSQLRTAFIGVDSRAGDWWDAMSGEEKIAVRNRILATPA